MRIAFVGTVICSFALQLQATASTILVADQRSLEVSGTGLGCATSDSAFFYPAAPFVPFDAQHSLPADLGGSVSAGQDSVVGPAQLSGVGQVANSSGTQHFCGVSTYQISFQLDQATPYQFDGTFDIPSGTEAAGQFYLDGDGGLVFSHAAFDASGVYAESGLLAAGDYTLFASVRTGYDGVASFDFELQLVPEPSTAVLLGLGLGALGAVRGRVRSGDPRRAFPPAHRRDRG